MTFLGLMAILLVLVIVSTIFTMPLIIYMVIERICRKLKKKTSLSESTVRI